MLEWIFLFVVSVSIVKIAMADARSPAIWGVISFGFCLFSVLTLPLPFFRLGAGFLAAFLLMTFTNIGKMSDSE